MSLPRLVSAVGGALLLIVLARAAFTLRAGGSLLEVLVDFLLVGVPGLTLAYTCFWILQSDIDRRYYRGWSGGCSAVSSSCSASSRCATSPPA
ncbi:MAG: hypothetical protein V5A62_11180 [Haloarculaceae archaeon]